MIKPQPLKKGDTVAIVSPAAALREPMIVQKAEQTLQAMGLNTVTAPHCLTHNGYYAGTTAERAEDIISMITDESVKAILCSYGGFGCVHIVKQFAETIEKNPKWIIGMSDCSVLLAACASKGIMSLHSPQCRELAEHPNGNATKALLNILFGEETTYSLPPHPLNISGEANGTLIGGNLSVLCSLLRTPYDIFTQGTILFIEDINEPVYRIERMMYNLKLAGVLENIKGLIVGRFTGTKELPGFGGTPNEIIHRLIADCNIPVCFDFPVGHSDENMPLIVGAEAEFNVSDEGCRIRFL